MVPLTALIVPIVLAAVIVFVLSSIIHMLLGYHRNDVRKLAAEDEVQAALRKFSIPPGDYALPCAGSMEAMKAPAFVEKLNKGPVVFMTVLPGGSHSMGPTLAMWFLYCVVVNIFAAYVAGRALSPDAHYLEVFRFVGTTAFVGYALALWQHSIWYKRAWTTTIISTFDGLVYALFTAGTFGWLWP